MKYTATYIERGTCKVVKVITDRTAESVAEWLRKYHGAESVKVEIDDNPNSSGEMVIRI